jgi:soluble lytic murein transglycosylase-like protein
MYRIPFLIGLAVVGAALAAFALLGAGDDAPELAPLQIADDPFAYEPDREQEFTERAAAGHSHVIYEKSPDGVLGTARRVEAYRPQVEAAAAEAGVDPDLVEAMVFLESAGRSEVMASTDVEGAVGLTQILAETAVSLLGMRVDVKESQRLTRRIARADRQGAAARSAELRARRRRVDERFDPAKALAGTGRYLRTAMDEFGREDLAVTSYHMGIGNLQSVLAAYGANDVSYTQVYFDATPDRHPQTYRLLSGLGDDSKTYLWRVLASAEVMRLYREDRADLARLDDLHGAKASAEEVLHPPDSTEIFESAEDLEEAYLGARLRPFPNEPARYGLRRDPRMGELAGRLDSERRLYRGLRPEALALALYVAEAVRAISDSEAALIVTSTVRDTPYQRALARDNPEATHAYSLHTTGFAFDVRRDYRSRAQAVAFQYMLDRLQSLNLIAWVREPQAIHITVAGEARELIDR